MIDRQQHGRFANGATTLTVPGEARRDRVARMRAVRDVVTTYGYDRERTAAALAGHHPNQLALF